MTTDEAGDAGGPIRPPARRTEAARGGWPIWVALIEGRRPAPEVASPEPAVGLPEVDEPEPPMTV